MLTDPRVVNTRTVHNFVPMLLFSVLMTATSEVGAGSVDCHPRPMTLTERLAKSDAAVLGRWVESRTPKTSFGGSTTFTVIKVAHGPKSKLKPDEKITVPNFLGGMKGDLFFLTGDTDETGEEIDWNSPLKVTDTAYRYIVQAPPPAKPATLRLEYFLKFLEASDPLISKDAHDEFNCTAYDDIVKIKDKLDRATIRQWITDAKTDPLRLTLYGRLLGLCGNADDAAMLRARIGGYDQEYRFGLDGLISGYLLLTGAEGLDFIDEKILKAKDVAFPESWRAMLALQFLWFHGDGRISQDRLKQSMRELLDEPLLAVAVIADLTHWKDWSVQDRLMKLYGNGEYDTPLIKRRIAYFLLTMEKSLPPDSAAARETRMNIEKLRVQDPTTVKQVEKFLSLP